MLPFAPCPDNVLNQDLECVICIDPLKKNEDVVFHAGAEGIKHPLHRKCAKVWTQMRNICPSCNQVVDSNSLFTRADKLKLTMRNSLIKGAKLTQHVMKNLFTFSKTALMGVCLASMGTGLGINYVENFSPVIQRSILDYPHLANSLNQFALLQPELKSSLSEMTRGDSNFESFTGHLHSLDLPKQFLTDLSTLDEELHALGDPLIQEGTLNFEPQSLTLDNLLNGKVPLRQPITQLESIAFRMYSTVNAAEKYSKEKQFSSKNKLAQINLLTNQTKTLFLTLQQVKEANIILLGELNKVSRIEKRIKNNQISMISFIARILPTAFISIKASKINPNIRSTVVTAAIRAANSAMIIYLSDQLSFFAPYGEMSPSPFFYPAVACITSLATTIILKVGKNLALKNPVLALNLSKGFELLATTSILLLGAHIIIDNLQESDLPFLSTVKKITVLSIIGLMMEKVCSKITVTTISDMPFR